MKVVAAIDSFKGSLGSREAGEAAIAGVREAVPDAETIVLEVADGGEGTLQALVNANQGRLVGVDGYDAVGRPINAPIGLYEREGRTRAVVECARTVGIDLVAVDHSLPPRGNSQGVGLHLQRAIESGAEEVLVTLGGSATTDGGTGLFQALGARIVDAEGREIGREENPLWRFGTVDVSGLLDTSAVALTILSDVTNPLCGPRGAAAVFGPQKGANRQQVAHLDSAQGRWADALHEAFGVEVRDTPGAGAAGGLGAALLALGGTMQSGFDRVVTEIGLAEALVGADLVLTGEGRLDSQSAHGKVPFGVASAARSAGAVVVALAGRLERPLGDMSPLLDGAFAIHSEVRPLAEALDEQVTAAELHATAFEVTRLMTAARAHDRR